MTDRCPSAGLSDSVPQVRRELPGESGGAVGRGRWRAYAADWPFAARDQAGRLLADCAALP